MKENPNNYGIIPAKVRYSTAITDFEKILFVELTALADESGFAYATNKYLAERFHKSENSVSRSISNLVQEGFIHREVVRNEKKEIIQRKLYPLCDHLSREVSPNLSIPIPKNEYTPIPKNGKENSKKIINTKNNNNIEPQKEIEETKEQNDVLAIVHDQVDETAVKVVDVIPSKAKKQPKYIYPPTIEELVQPIYEKLIEKKRIHTNIVDCWNNANMQAEKFHIHWEEKGWKIEKLNLAIAKWINNSISYGQVTKPCPIQYKGNPANAQPAPAKVHVEETKSPEQSKEARKAMFAAAKAELNQIGA